MTISRAARLARIAFRWLGLLLIMIGTGSASAQSAPDADAVDPPGRVGSITLLAGPATMVDLATGSREDALLNWPVTGGWRMETGHAARAEVRIGSTALRLDNDTTVDFVRIDDEFMQIAVLRGSVSVRLRNPEILNELEVLTQRERVVFEQTGAYRIDVDRAPGVTTLSAFAGQARVAVGGSSFVVASGQRGDVSTAPMASFRITAAVADSFDDWVAARDAREDAIRSAGYVSRETTGVEVLDDYGDWRNVDEYGAVWFPRTVVATWAPYRFGRWVWISPWGWTWVDEAPWGFAPLHYGRWVVVGGVWGWVPGIVVARPVFAPALVAWYSWPAVNVRGRAPIGWFPLGPREPYVPVHRHSPRYLRVINVQHVPNVEQVTIVQTPRYVHRHPDRSTWVPDDRFGRPEPLPRGQRPPPSEWRQYIARPQPPANVPNTKRRQASDAIPAGPSASVPGSPGEARPSERQPPVRPRAEESPRLPDATRPSQMPRAQPASPIPPQMTAPNRSLDSPRPPDLQRAQPAYPPAMRQVPSATQVAPPAAPRTVEVPRAAPVQPPSVRPEAPTGGAELPEAARNDRRMAPRAPMPSTRQAPPTTPPAESPLSRGLPPAQPRSPATEPPVMRGRGDAAPYAGDGYRQAPRAPSVPAAGASAPPVPLPQPVPPTAAPPAGREASPAPPPARAAPPSHEVSGDPPGQPFGRAPRREMAR